MSRVALLTRSACAAMPCVRCSLSSCHILTSRDARALVGVATYVSIVTLLYDIPKYRPSVPRSMGEVSIRPATSAYLKIHWHHCRVSVVTYVPIVALLYDIPKYRSSVPRSMGGVCRVSVATYVSIVALLYDIPKYRPSRLMDGDLPIYAGVGVQFLVGVL